MISGISRIADPVSETEQTWSLYMLRCGDGSFYTGISTDVQRRLLEHSGAVGKGRGAKALRGRGPLTLAYQISLTDKSEALKLEYKVKQLSRARKESVVKGRLDPLSLLTL